MPLTPQDLTTSSHEAVPILGAMGIRVLEAGHGRALAELPREPNVNHFGALYAGSLFSVVEMLGGAIVRATFDLDDELAGFVPLVKSMEIHFRRPALGTVWARAELALEDLERIPRQALERGKADYTLTAEIVDAEETVLVTTTGLYQLRRF